MNNPLHLYSNSNYYYSLVDVLESKSISWILIPDHRDPWRSTLSWITFFILTFVVPVLSHSVFQCSDCDHNHYRPFDSIVQVSLSLFSTLSFVILLQITRKYGLRRFLFLDKLEGVRDHVRLQYSDELRRSTMLLCAFTLPCFLADSVYNIWWFTSGGTQIPYFNNIYLSHAMACMMHMSSWLYRTSLFLLVCVLFKLTCSLQILRLDDFAQVFDKLSYVGPILVEHLTIRRNLHVISHRFRAFILSTLVLVTASQFASLLVTTVEGSIVNISTTGELAVKSPSLLSYIYICQCAFELNIESLGQNGFINEGGKKCAILKRLIQKGTYVEDSNLTLKS